MVLELDGEHLTQKAEIKESFLEEVIPQASLFLCVCVCNKVLLKYKGDRESF